MASTYSTGQLYQVTVTALSGTAPFIGFALQAFDSNNVGMGSFVAPANYQILCTGGTGITHTSSVGKGPTASFTWTPPSTGGQGPVKFRATVMAARTTWWTIESVAIAESTVFIFKVAACMSFQFYSEYFNNRDYPQQCRTYHSNRCSDFESGHHFLSNQLGCIKQYSAHRFICC
jgi:hypothetical protein